MARGRSRLAWGAAACAVLLAGCDLTPAFVRPDLPTAQSYPNDGHAAAGSIASVRWRDFFTDPGLQALIQDALDNNRDLRVAVSRVEAARAAYRVQNAPLFPSLDAFATGTRGRTPADLSGTGRAETAGDYQAALSASWEIDFWGRLRNLSQSARETYLATEEARRAVQVSLIEQVVDSYLLDRDYAERIIIARQTIVNRQESFRIARRRYEVGAGSKLDMTQAQTLLSQAQTDVQALEQAREQNADALTLLVGRPSVIAAPPLTMTDVDVERDLPPGLPSELMVNRPDILAAEHRLRAAHADIGAARAAFFPNIRLTSAFGTASSQLDGLFGSGSRSWSFTPTLTTPIFDAGANAGNLDIAKARRDIAVADYEHTIQAAFRDVADALAARRWLAGQIQTTEDELTALTERARLSDLSYTNGRAAYLEVLESQRDLFAAQQALVQLRRAFLESGVDLYAAVGGGADDTAPAEQAKK